MYYLEITKDMETTEPVELTIKIENHTVFVTGYKVTDDWLKTYRIDESEYDGNTEDLEQDLHYIEGELDKLLTGDYIAIWTRD